MSIPAIRPAVQPAHTESLRLEGAKLLAQSLERPPDGPGKDADVKISNHGQRMRAQRDLLYAYLGGSDTEFRAGGRSLLEAAGRSEYLASVSNPTDLSPEATAERILGGIRGYIYGAFSLAHPDATDGEFERFTSDVMRGFERGTSQARQVFEGLKDLEPDLAEEIARTQARVRDGLEAFFEEQRKLRSHDTPTA